MNDNNPVVQDDKRSGSVLLAGKLTSSVAVGIALQNLVAFPEAIERNPFGGSITAIVIVAWLLHNVYLARIGSQRD